MKLLSCHILSFGKLHDLKFDFCDRLTIIKEDNSFGKTTLANFITSMFYGLPDLKVKDLSNDRRRYDPWQGGVYGGSLAFEYEGKKYQVERDFNKKNDAFRLTDISTSAKKDVFQINGKPVDGTNLGDILFDINKSGFKRSAYIPQDEIVCGEIDSGLNDKLRNLINATDENHSLEKSLNLLQKAVEAIETKRGKGRLKEIDDRILDLRNKIKECEICFDNAEQSRKDLLNLKESLKKYEAEIERYDDQIKSQNEIETLSAQQKHYAAIKENIKNCEEKKEKLLPFFNGQNIEEIDLDLIKEKIDAFKRRQTAFKDKEDETLSERSRLYSLEEAMLARQERKKTLHAQIAGFENDKKRIIAEKEKIERDIDAYKNQQRKNKGVIFAILCILTFGLFYIFTKNREKQSAVQIAELQKSINSCNLQYDDFENKIIDFKKQIAEIDSSDNPANQSRLSDLKAELSREEELLEQLKQETEKALGSFSCTARNYDDRFHEIKENYNEIRKAQGALTEYQAKLTEFLKDKDKTKLFAKIETGFPVEELLKNKSEIDRQRLKCIKDIVDTESRINRNDDKADDLPDYQNELSSCEESKERLIAELNIIKKTIGFLTEANDNLANQYLSPLAEKSRNIIKLYDEQKCDLEFDVNSKILIKEKGTDRELDCFSKGIKELISICMRISLLDIIFKDNSKRPCVILDDPFVNLDDQKLVIAKDFIKKLSEQYQIVYLTCHNSRAISV